MFKLSFSLLVAVVTGAPAGALVHETAVSQSDNAMPDIPVQLRAELQAEVDVAETALAQEKTALQEAKSAAASAEADMETKQNAWNRTPNRKAWKKRKAKKAWEEAKEKFENMKEIEEEVQTAYDDAKAELDAAKSFYKYSIETGPCGRGEYKVAANDYDGITSCKECPKYENLDHVELHFDTECHPCPMGNRLIGDYSTGAWYPNGCVPCDPGTYSAEVNFGYSKCWNCKKGKYTRPEDNGGFGQSQCKGLCGVNEESNMKSKDKSACYKCPTGKYGTEINIGHQCKTCNEPSQHPNCASMEKP